MHNITIDSATGNQAVAPNNDNTEAPRSAAETLADMQRIARERILAPRHAIGDPIAITATVVGVNFTASKVNYVAQIGDTMAIVDSCDVEPAAKVAP